MKPRIKALGELKASKRLQLIQEVLDKDYLSSLEKFDDIDMIVNKE